MASKIFLCRSISRAINRSVFMKQRRGFCDVYPDSAPPTRPPESVLAELQKKGRFLGESKDTKWDFSNDFEPIRPQSSSEVDWLPGQDLEHIFVEVRFADRSIMSDRDAVIDNYIKLLAQVVGSEEEAKKRIYSVSTKHYFGFGALVPEEEYHKKLSAIPRVGEVVYDRYEDVENKRYPWEPFVDGEAVPYDPKYHVKYLANPKPGVLRSMMGMPHYIRNKKTGKVSINYIKPRGRKQV